MDYPNKVCDKCSSTYYRRKSTSASKWKQQVYCSKACSYESRKKLVPPKTCIGCGKVYERPHGRGKAISDQKWEKRKYCTTECGNAHKSSPWLEKYQLKPGSTLGKATQFRKGQTKGTKNTNWKGEKASYAAHHIWMKNNYGKPQECNHCGTTEDRMYHWANISGKYLRQRDDWKRLCVPCHKVYDRGRR